MPISFVRGLAWLAPAAALLLAATGAAQSRGAPDATDLALAWARGGFASPAVCRFGDRARRGLRRVLIAPGPRTSELRVDRVQFFDLAAKGAERCLDELGAEERNVIGTLYVTHVPKRPRSDTPERDLKQDLERGPLVFPVVRGRLRVGPASAAAETLPEVDFAGGTLRLGLIEPGSDDARRIADVPGLRQLRLEAEAKDGTRIAFPLVEVERR
jgi:hypothetical protein